MKLQRQIAKNRVALALPIALLMATNAWSATKEDIYFINERGRLAQMNNCTLIDAAYLEEQQHTTVVNTSVTCFFVDDTLEYSGHFSLTASDVTFIISDKAKFTINYNSSDNSTHALHASGNLKIFGQKNQAGSLIVNETGSNYSRGLSAGGTLQIYGGHVTATSNARDAIWANGNIDIYGGYVSATGAGANTNYVGIKSETGNINVNWVNSLYANSYMISSGKAIKIADGLTLTDGSNEYSGSNPSIAGKTLTPADYLVQFVTNDDNSKRAIINGEYKGTASVTDIAAQSNVVVIEYNRTFTAGKPSTVVLPFSLQEGATTNAKFYRLTDVVKKDGACAWEATAQNIATDPKVVNKLPQANEPYIVMLNEGNKLEFYLSSSSVTFNPSNNTTTTVSGGNWSFIGVYSYTVWNDPNDEELGLAYGFAGSNEDNIAQGEFGKIAIAADAATTSYPSANPFRAYLRKKDNTVKLQCPQAVLGQNSAQYSLGHNSETIDVHFIDEDENGEKTTFMARMNTRTGEFTMLRNFDIKGRKINAANKVRGAYYGKKVIKQ
jgi:hypothetical protein